jgi:hypothetical protein
LAQYWSERRKLINCLCLPEADQEPQIAIKKLELTGGKRPWKRRGGAEEQTNTTSVRVDDNEWKESVSCKYGNLNAVYGRWVRGGCGTTDIAGYKL